VSASCLLHVKNFKFFIFWVILSFFFFNNHVQVFFSSFHYTFLKYILSTLRSYGVKANEYE